MSEEQNLPNTFGNIHEFVAKGLRIWWDRNLKSKSYVWCDEWWKHSEATLRIEVLWRSFEQITKSNDPVALSAWLKDMDYHLGVLTEPTGTFRYCAHGHQAPEKRGADEFPLVTPPPSWFNVPDRAMPKKRDTDTKPVSTTDGKDTPKPRPKSEFPGFKDRPVKVPLPQRAKEPEPMPTGTTGTFPFEIEKTPAKESASV